MDQIETMQQVVDQAKRILSGVRPDQLGAPSPCEDWDARGVIDHIAGGGKMFAAAFEQGSVPDALMGEIMTADNVGDDPAAAFAAVGDSFMDAIRAPGALERTLVLPWGEMPGTAALDLAIFDVTVHTWDLAKATDQVEALDPDVLETALEVGRRIIQPEFRAPGVLGAEQPVADGAPVADRLAAFAGRQP